MRSTSIDHMIQNIDQDEPAEEYIAYMYERHRDGVVRDA